MAFTYRYMECVFDKYIYSYIRYIYIFSVMAIWIAEMLFMLFFACIAV